MEHSPAFVLDADRAVVGPAPFRAIDAASVVVERGRIAWFGPRAALPEGFASLQRRHVELLTPALVDAHTHAAWVGSRHGEFVSKLRGESYELIAARGGGIAASMRAVAASSAEEIARVLRSRLARMAALGVATVEIKSGYGPTPELERRQLEAIREVSRDPDLPRVVPTVLALHALPPEVRARIATENAAENAERVAGPIRIGARASYIAQAVNFVREVARDGLAVFADAYVDRAAFTVEEARLVLRAARESGLGLRMHVGQFADVGGAKLAVELRAHSADHLENVAREDLDAMAREGVSATLLPVASFVLRQSPPPIEAMRAAGVRLVVASDANPGTAPTESLPLAMALAARDYGLGIDEILEASTRNAALSLGLSDTGSIETGHRADLVGWRLPHEEALLQPWAVPQTSLVLRDGRALFAGEHR